MLRLDFNLVLNMINLVILFLLLRKFLFRPLMDIMEKREAMIADGLKNASDQQAKAMEMKQQYEDALSGAKDESARLIEQAKKEAKAEYDRIVTDAGAEAERYMKQAKEAMDTQREQTIREMKSQVATLAMDAARKVLANEDPAVSGQAAYDQFLKEAGDSHDGKDE